MDINYHIFEFSAIKTVIFTYLNNFVCCYNLCNPLKEHAQAKFFGEKQRRVFVSKSFRSIGSVVLFLSVLIGLLVFAGQVMAESDKRSDANSEFEFVDGQLVISIEADAGKASLKQTHDMLLASDQLSKAGFQVTKSLLNSLQTDVAQAKKQDLVDEMGLVYLVEYAESTYHSLTQAKSELKKTLEHMDLKVRYIHENYMMQALETSLDKAKPMAVHPNQEWHYNMIKAPQAWQHVTGSSSTRIAVLDTGIDSYHASLSNLVNTSLGRSFVGGDTGDRAGHGTHVAGTIASYGSVSGVMQNATLIPVKVLGDDGYGSMYGIMEGITYAASIGADVINMSLGGGGYFQGMDEAISAANNQGTIVVAATGNDGVSTVSYPAAYSGSIAVGSVTSNKSRSYFSNYGSGLDVMAPGSNIYSTVPNNRYASMSGTSMATPHVAGVLGLMRSANPNISVQSARSILTATAENAGSSYEYGHGIVNANAAVQSALGNDGGDDGQAPSAPQWQAYTWYSTGDEVTYNGTTYVSRVSHYSFPGWEPPYTPQYWTKK